MGQVKFIDMSVSGRPAL